MEKNTLLEQPITGMWWHNNFLAYVLTGEALFKTPRGEYTFKAGDCVFAKKGSMIVHLLVKDYFTEICALAKPSIKEIMDANFFSNLSLEEFAKC